ncbi:hypothetical protein LDJ81_00055 [Lentilactobacillus parabuchneri]|uniref:hypothetical protein n=1 Tax=Lentilactobacillus parabuchneri TaxID=152331 RepID=UPI0022366CBC|nr:hypothetical protein [Lentilactobacillus parabuchneri]MCW4397423.1 hypothetical protein [Lentilactobacillus parabuchneri]
MNQDAEKTPSAICGSKECNKEKIVPMTKESRKRAFNLLSKILSELYEPNSSFVTIFELIKLYVSK